MTYDDLLTRLRRRALGRATPRPRAAARALQVVLVDEFQDTDPVQWDILRARVRRPGDVTLVLIGDPKQAIYAFRGADVYAYLEAAARRGHARDARRQLAQRPGPDRRLRRALRRRPARARGHRLPHVAAAAAQPAPRLTGAPDARRCGCGSCTATTGPIAHDRGGCAATPSAREHIADDLAADSWGCWLAAHDRAPRRRRRPLGASACARATSPCSCARNRNAALVRDALEAVGVPAVINGAGSVFGTAPARDWLRLLEALERPASRAARPRRGADAVPRLDARSGSRPPTTSDWEERPPPAARTGRALLRTRGRGGADRDDRRSTRACPRACCATQDGERRLTDLRHVGQLLHAGRDGRAAGRRPR